MMGGSENAHEKTDEYLEALKKELNDSRSKSSGYPELLQRSFKTAAGQDFPDREGNDNKTLRVLQYNILADVLATETGNFDKVPKDCLNWTFRKNRIVEQILLLNPDILCLEEVDHFNDIFKPLFNGLGFNGFFFPKKDSPCLRIEGNNGPDGVAIFYRKSKLQLLGNERKYLENAEKGESNQPIMACMLRNEENKKNICIAVTHFKAKKGFENLRAAQANSSMKIIQDLRKRFDPESAVVFCGDFNGIPSESFYEIIENEEGGYLKSAYKRAIGKELAYTTWKIRQDVETKHTIDYIWFSHNALNVISYLDLPADEEIPEEKLPSYSSPSDHLPLCCDFCFKE